MQKSLSSCSWLPTTPTPRPRGHRHYRTGSAALAGCCGSSVVAHMQRGVPRDKSGSRLDCRGVPSTFCYTILTSVVHKQLFLSPKINRGYRMMTSYSDVWIGSHAMRRSWSGNSLCTTCILGRLCHKRTSRLTRPMTASRSRSRA